MAGEGIGRGKWEMFSKNTSKQLLPTWKRAKAQLLVKSPSFVIQWKVYGKEARTAHMDLDKEQLPLRPTKV